MKISFLCIGKTHYTFLKEGEAEYLKRLQHYLKIERIELPELKNTKSLSIEEIKKREKDFFLSRLSPQDTIILLDENGTRYSSFEFAQFLKKTTDFSRNIVFIVGGAYGFSSEMYARATHLLSLSNMTFSHQMIRMIFFEQLYRACTILNNQPYHHQ